MRWRRIQGGVTASTQEGCRKDEDDRAEERWPVWGPSWGWGTGAEKGLRGHHKGVGGGQWPAKDTNVCFQWRGHPHGKWRKDWADYRYIVISCSEVDLYGQLAKSLVEWDGSNALVLLIRQQNVLVGRNTTFREDGSSWHHLLSNRPGKKLLTTVIVTFL